MRSTTTVSRYRLPARVNTIIVFGLLAGLIGPFKSAWADSDSPPETSKTKSAGALPRGQRPANRLARETSPYLLLHAHNPVDWYPWSPEVFEKAKREGKPIFVSIGYSSCHWCHVMERLVFENEDIARVMNANFVNVKVDREERPDVDDIYMTAYLVYAQAVGSGDSGGWPLSMFLTPDGKPFAGGTYFPPQDRPGQPGFPTVLARVSNAWRTDHASVEKNAEMICNEVRRLSRAGFNPTPVKLERGLVTATVKSLIESRDPEFGGIDFDPHEPNMPKFPEPAKLDLLEFAARHSNDLQADAVVTNTLDHIAAGGIVDHLAGGFHRYSTDRRWHVPHFEKMLYDQAQLAELFAEVHHRTGKREYRRVAEQAFGFVLREMTEPAGGFISSLDAQTDGVEGVYYVWTPAEVDAALGSRDGGLFRRAFGLNEPKEFEPGFVLRRTASVESLGHDLHISPEEIESRLNDARTRLLLKRQSRPPVARDDKILAAWNGLMIRALARSSQTLGNDAYLHAAEKAANFVLEQMRGPRGKLFRTYRAGQAKIPAYLEDYAYLSEGFLALFAATHEPRWQQAARALTDEQIRLFWDEQSKGFYFTSTDHEALIARTRNAFDAVLPSANAVSVRNLIRLTSLCGEPRYRDLARQTLEAFAPALAKAPRSLPVMALALEEYLDNPDFRGSHVRSKADANLEETAVLQASGDDAPTNSVPARNTTVTAKAYLSVDKLPPGGTCRFVVYVAIKDGWHINMNQVAADWQVPTELTIASKQGVTVAKVNYGPGRATQLPGIQGPMTVYEKSAEIRGVLAIPAESAGKPDDLQFLLKYQACNAKGECLPPAKVKLTGRVPIAPNLQSVHAANPNLFPKLPPAGR
ncbi:MAG TPA: DUF255 domain-containing protein [Planctomycetaceae bacterium]|jgi:uncharacterized protein YyaL (SSP411 family)|nr:DUF255 domain-containing protein [Planctomycetaceae bacterium]